jgi:hypothetical protein
MLRSELARLRNTFSFRLGLLITQTFFRKPWRIPIFPFLFIHMIYQYAKEEKMRKKSNRSPFTTDESVLMLFVASEGGMAACDRAKSITLDWLSKRGNQIVIVTSNIGLAGFYQEGVILYTIPDPKSKEVTSKSNWNLSCQNVVYRAILTHTPISFIFDGPYPYRGILNAIQSVPELDTVWFTSERTEQHILDKCSSSFIRTVQRNYSERTIISRTSRTRTYHSISNKLLIATNYGSHGLTTKLPKIIARTLSTHNNVKLVGLKSNLTSKEDEEIFAELWTDLEDEKRFNALQGAIVSDNLEIISALHGSMIPTLCILHEKTTTETRKEIQELALAGGLFVTSWDEKEELELYINALVNADWNLAITQNNTTSTQALLKNLVSF